MSVTNLYHKAATGSNTNLPKTEVPFSAILTKTVMCAGPKSIINHCIVTRTPKFREDWNNKAFLTVQTKATCGRQFSGWRLGSWKKYYKYHVRQTCLKKVVLGKLPVEFIWFPLGQNWVRSLPTSQREGNVDLLKAQVTPTLLEYITEQMSASLSTLGWWLMHTAGTCHVVEMTWLWPQKLAVT